jgi:ABC-type Na+ transport system ATPase subunit NatA
MTVATVASTERALAVRAITLRDTGSSLVRSLRFQERFPATSGLHHSGFLWLNTNGVLADLANLVDSPAIKNLMGSRDPILVVIDGETERIHAASRTRLTSLILDVMLAGGEFRCAIHRTQPGKSQKSDNGSGALTNDTGYRPASASKLGRREILQGLSCRLGTAGAGKAIGLLGPNGAGKSTLIQTLLGFHKPISGSARILGFDCHTQTKQVKGRVGYMPENDAFIADLTAVSFLRIMGELSGLPPRVALEKAHEVLFHVGLGEARYRAVGTYSLGMKQMAKLAQAILHGPELVILDEPTNGLDPAARVRMLKLERDEGGHGMSVICATSAPRCGRSLR